MKTLAAILVETKKPLIIDEIEIPSLKPGQVLVEIKYSGVCHTQLLETRGHRGEDAFLPHLLGHEGSGIVLELGANVSKVNKGDNVILSWMKGSGANVFSTSYNWKNKIVNAGAITTFNKYAVISENRLTKFPDNFPLKEAALIGCALPTGLGTIFNTAKPSPGESMAIFGCGGIGLSALLGAKLSGCAPIIAIDIFPEKLQLAKKMGASHIIDASSSNTLEELKKIGTIDYAIDCSGNINAMNQALLAVRAQGGCAVIVGNAHYGNKLSIDPKEFNLGKKILGTWGGDNNPDIHFHRYINILKHHKVDLFPFTSNVYRLEEINKALDDLESGKVVRPIIDMQHEQSL